MDDSANILSILATLGQDGSIQQPPAANVLQAMAPAAAPDPAPMPVQAPAPVAAPAPAAHSDEHPRKRLSVIDTIGRIADVFARVGGAQALYQPVIEANQDRVLKLGDHARTVDADNLALATGRFDLSNKQGTDVRKRIGTALSALAGQENAAALWPDVAAQAGITDPQQIAQVGAILEKSPGSAAIFAKALGAGPDKLGKNVYFGTDASGKTVAYQVGDDGNPHPLDFSTSGITPSEPSKVVDTGNGQAVVGQSGTVKKILPKFARPDTILTTRTQKEIASGHDQTQITIAGMPARAKSGSGANSKAGDANVPTLLNNIESGFNDLHGMKALPGDGGNAVGQLTGALGRTSIGQSIGEQAGAPAAQKRLEIMKNVSALQQAMLKSLPASATRTKFEQEMLARGLPDPTKMSLATARTVISQLRQSYAEAVTSLNAEQPKSAGKPAANIKPAGRRAQPAAGWSIVSVK